LAAWAVIEGKFFTDLRLVFFAVGDRPVLAKAAQSLVRVAITPAVLSDASMALGEELDPQQDQQATASMRQHLAKVLMARCINALLGGADLNGGKAE
jgi:carbon-monoxide dehydrogenase medium subunit